MHFSSQVCTTKKQSEQLLALDLKIEIADIGLFVDIPIVIENWETRIY